MKANLFKGITALLLGSSLGMIALAQENQPSLEELFLGSVQITNAFAVESARVGLQKPSSVGVKQLAQTLVNDHTRAQQNVSRFFDGLYAGGGSLGPSSSGDNRASEPTGQSPRNPSNAESPSGDNTRVSGGNVLSNTPSAEQTLGGGTPGTGENTRTSNSTRDEGSATRPPDVRNPPSYLSSLSYDQQLRIRALSALSGTAFNTAFATDQVSAHETAVRNVRFAVSRLTNPAIKTFAQQLLVTLEKNLRAARALPR
jgi:predicted outer membrane protein